MKIFGSLIFLLTVTMLMSACVGVSQNMGTPPPTNAPATILPTEAPTTAPLLPTRIQVPTGVPTDTTALPTATAEAIPTAGGGNVQDPQLQKMIQEARTDLTQRANVSDNAIKVQSAQPMEWPDASLGCPRRGVFYIQVITPGYLILLEANGKMYEYHTSYDRVMYCEK